MPKCSDCPENATIICKGCSSVFCNSDWNKKHICGRNHQLKILFVANPDSGRNRVAMRYIMRLPEFLQPYLPWYHLYGASSDDVYNGKYDGITFDAILIVDQERDISKMQQVLRPMMKQLFPEAIILYMRLIEEDGFIPYSSENVVGNDSPWSYVPTLAVNTMTQTIIDTLKTRETMNKLNKFLIDRN